MDRATLLCTKSTISRCTPSVITKQQAFVLFFSRPRSEGGGRTMNVLSPFISVLCHSDSLFHGESCPRLDVVHPGCACRSEVHSCACKNASREPIHAPFGGDLSSPLARLYRPTISVCTKFDSCIFSQPFLRYRQGPKNLKRVM